MMMGNSGALITVNKTGGGQDLTAEADLLIELGNQVCPKFIAFYKEGYTMEYCTSLSPPVASQYIFQCIHNLLKAYVWDRDSIYPPTNWAEANYNWRLEHAPWILDCNATKEITCLTHGDPTLANVVFRKETGQLLLCDPLPPRPEFPSTRSVDYGKMLQSAAGWEHQLDYVWPDSTPFWLLENLIPKEYHQNSLFWAAFHCARIAVRNPKHKDWAISTSKKFVEMAK